MLHCCGLEKLGELQCCSAQASTIAMFNIIHVGQKCSSGLFGQALHWFESAARRFLLEHSSVYQRSVSKAVSSI